MGFFSNHPEDEKIKSCKDELDVLDQKYQRGSADFVNRRNELLKVIEEWKRVKHNRLAQEKTTKKGW